MQMRGNIFLLIAAFIWGTTFVAQQVGMEELGPFTYAAARFFLGTLFLAGLWLLDRKRREYRKQRGLHHSGWKLGLGAGLLLFTASSLQQYALQFTTVGKTSFITALYIVLVPLGAALFRLARVYMVNWMGAMLAMGGLYLLTIQGTITLNPGDMLVALSALGWTAQILYIDRFAPHADVLELSLSQTICCFVASLLAALGTETMTLAPVLNSWISIAYAGVLSTGVAFTLQIVGQKYAAPSEAAVIMSFEAVFGALASFLILGEQMTTAQLWGCILMFAGVIVSQLRTIMNRSN
ncbi:hypothetical protein SELR_pSRC102650 (plasmid) [Selenomonas ruminantium subsp. lactilytica TAM6421]|uniref:EamA domain-containing protein n=1 Tax=Selenomonas ruminantium subsp. lactilytica (strain NBRC 103574 / TAM6421) TaxID=927704 RepID=I0GWD5_SELRL|nr:DMT family transporter [Selenomonas ruminantium]BAL85072.1 hypothetical protein SELR_pSRC102650 [Selenomonas ruminantium subsp. lactilytica TAM6421]